MCRGPLSNRLIDREIPSWYLPQVIYASADDRLGVT